MTFFLHLCCFSLFVLVVKGWSFGKSFLESDIQRLVDLDISSYFTSSEISLMTSNKRIRREIRDIEYSEWKKIANAMNVMKFTDHETGISKYGNKFWNYDKLTCFHARIAYSKKGDLNHLNPSFSPWHRTYLLMFEESILSIDPTISAIPYWDYRRDTDEPLNSIVWTELYFGELMGDEDNGHGIKNGPFAYWPVHNNASELGCDNVKNIWGQLRNPVHQEKSQYITRMGSAMCNKTNVNIGTAEEWNECLDISTYGSYLAVDSCYEGTFHFYAHTFVGGSRAPNTPKVIKTQDEYDDNEDGCLSWSGSEYINVENHKVYKLYSHPEFKCFDCPNDCHINNDNIKCTSCKVVNTTCKMNIYNETYSASFYSETEEFIWGDMADPITSPNDPFFWFHHINLDRFIFIWQLHLFNQRPYYWYPTSGYEVGINLDDIAGDEWPFTNLFDMYDSQKQLTYRDIFDATTFVNCPYSYDDVIAALQHGGNGTVTKPSNNINKQNNKQNIIISYNNILFILSIGVITMLITSFWIIYSTSQKNTIKNKKLNKYGSIDYINGNV